jgi:hypothetical protein
MKRLLLLVFALLIVGCASYVVQGTPYSKKLNYMSPQGYHRWALGGHQ